MLFWYTLIMNIYREIYNLKGEKSRLEIALIEERYHYESIPKRKAISKSKARLALLFAIPLSGVVLTNLALLIYAIIDSIKRDEPSALAAIILLVTPFTGVLLGVFVSKLWGTWLGEMGLMHGSHKNVLNYGAQNYKTEEILSHDKIATMSQKILDIDAKIAELRSRRTYEQVQNDKKDTRELKELSDDEFFAYAYGHWGDTKDDLIANMAGCRYEDEAESLRKRIADEKETLNNTAHIRSYILTEYEKAKNLMITYLISMFFVIFSQLAIFNTSMSKIVVMYIGIIYGMAGLLYAGTRFFKRRMAYMVECDYYKVTAYAEENRLEPTEFVRKRCMGKIRDYMNRLEYVDRLLDYKASMQNASDGSNDD